MFIASLKNIKPAWKITAAYFLAGVLWILFSDMVLSWFVRDVETMRVLQTAKGWFFVSVTGLMLLGLMRRSFTKADRRKAFDAIQASETALKESERQLSTLMANLPGMAYRCLNDREWTMVFASQGCLELTGYPPDALINNAVISYGDVIHPADRQKVWDEMQDKFIYKKPYPLVYRIITASGQVKWVWEQALGIFDEAGGLIFIEGFITDITERLNAEKSLKDYNELLRSLLENLSFPIFYKDLKGRILGCNLMFCEYLGITYDQIIGKTAWDLLSAEKAARIDQIDRQVFETLNDFRQEEQIFFPDGRVLDTMYHKSLFFNTEGIPQGYIGFYFDISERVRAEKIIKKQIEDLEKINSELEQFTYSVSHDLRSPLVTIKGSLNLLRTDIAGNDMEEIEQGLQRIEGATRRMHQLLEDLLELSRIGRIVNPFSEFSMYELACETEQYLHGILTESGASLTISKELPMVWGDRSRIGEVLQNLLENAVKFSRNDTPMIIEVGLLADKGEVVFFVKDNGIGIEAEHLDKVFILFKRFESDGDGTGLGLAKVKRIIDYHGGRVWAESEGKGQGATFFFTLNTGIKKSV